MQKGDFMFRLFLKDKAIYAPISGRCLDISECKDATFSSKALGDGIVILPDEEVVKSPCDGVVYSIFPTKHAISLITTDHKEILLHIGIDTVKMNGEYFTAFVKIGDKVKKGTPLIQYDAMYMAQHNMDMSIMLVLLNGGDFTYKKLLVNTEVKSGDKIIDFESGELNGTFKKD